MKGYTALLILKRILRTVQMEGSLAKEPLPCEVFDMICGTSTGGLIAVMLGRLKMSIDECLQTYEELGEDIFGKRPWGGKIGKFAIGMASSSLYSTDSLQNAVQNVLTRVEGVSKDDPFLETSDSLCRT
jgi:patatin-like phospholipase/acyl hydrolase